MLRSALCQDLLVSGSGYGLKCCMYLLVIMALQKSRYGSRFETFVPNLVYISIYIIVYRNLSEVLVVIVGLTLYPKEDLNYQEEAITIS